MIITNKLAKYKSGQSHSLEMFKLEPAGHLQKTWKSKDGKTQFVKDMQTMHLWFTYRMLLGIIETEQIYLGGPYPDGDGAQQAFDMEFETVMEQADMARNAIQYIGHELYKRQMMVPNLPEKNIKKKINRADNLHHGFIDKPGELLNYNYE
jgi:hypothetical protein